MTHGLIIGKFYPPHAGHLHLIRKAADSCDQLTVVVGGGSRDSYTPEQRAGWLSETFRHWTSITFRSIIVDCPIELDDDTVWEAQVYPLKALQRRLGLSPYDLVFSSETYGFRLAKELGAEHVLVDIHRERYPTSGTKVREGLYDNWFDLAPAVRRGLQTRIVTIGSESTGSTTLAKDLAWHYRTKAGVWDHTRWVPEYGRKFSEDWLQDERVSNPNFKPEDLEWEPSHLRKIAETQNANEAASSDLSSPLLVCDTDSFATTVWERRYFGEESRKSWKAGLKDGPSNGLYLLTDHRGISWEDDGTRDGPHVREEMTEWFADALETSGRSWVFVTGPKMKRLQFSIKLVEQELSKNNFFR